MIKEKPTGMFYRCKICRDYFNRYEYRLKAEMCKVCFETERFKQQEAENIKKAQKMRLQMKLVQLKMLKKQLEKYENEVGDIDD